MSTKPSYEELEQMVKKLEGQTINNKQTELALQESEKRFRELAESLPETIFEMDTEGNLTFVNRNAFDHFGYTPNDFKRGLNGFDMIFPEDRQKTMDNAKRILNGENVGLNEYTVLRKDGSTFPALFHSTAILREGEPVGWRGFVVDISKIKQLEAQLQEARKMEAIGTLTGGISHDFNNILGIIIGYAELALDDIPEENPVRINIEEIMIASLRAKDVVRQLLSFARKTDQERMPVKVNAIISDVLKLVRSIIPTSIEIRRNIPKESQIVFADPTQINQIMINLCTNAAHAMEKEGGILYVSLESVTLKESIAQSYELTPGRYVKLTVNDKGHGIDPKIKDRIFDPYFTTKEVGKGSGLGLSVVYGIVMNHDGAISVESEVGEGATVSIFLPIIEREPIPETIIDDDLQTGKDMDLQIDEKKNIAHIKLSGLLSREVILSAFDSTVADRKYKKGMGRLWDFRDADLSSLDSKVVTEMAQYSLKFPPGISDVKVAFVTSGSLEYGLSRMFEISSQAKTPVRVFRAMDEAEKWMME